jgi:hypothetical protein
MYFTTIGLVLSVVSFNPQMLLLGLAIDVVLYLIDVVLTIIVWALYH